MSSGFIHIVMLILDRFYDFFYNLYLKSCVSNYIMLAVKLMFMLQTSSEDGKEESNPLIHPQFEGRNSGSQPSPAQKSDCSDQKVSFK